MTSRNLTRRSAIECAAAGTLAIIFGESAFAGSEFWNRKPPSSWNAEEIHRLMNKSPWAKEVSIGLTAAAGPYGGAPDVGIGGVGGMGGGTGAGGGYGMGGGGGYGGMGGGGGDGRHGGGGARPNDAVIVRWESAQPMLDATKETLPKEFDGHYVIAVAGLPIGWGMQMARGRRAAGQSGQGEQAVRLSDIVERLEAGATLEAKGRDGEGAGVVKRAASDEAWLFGFSKELLPLGPGDKDIEFALTAGPMVIRAKFNPKDMMYKGRFTA